MLPFARKSLAPDWHAFGLDSVQGYRELAGWYEGRGVRFSCDPADRDRYDSMYFQLLQLEREGLIQLEWEPDSTGAGRELLRLISARKATKNEARQYERT